MSTEKVRILNKNGEYLDGVLHSCTDKDDIVVVCHGFALNKDNSLTKGLCEELNSSGFNCYRFDFSGCGRSEGNFSESGYTKEKGDLNSVITHLHRKGYRIRSVIGHSMGGTVVILQAAEDTRIKSVVAIAPRMFPVNHSIVKDSRKSIDELVKSAPITHRVTESGKERCYLISRRYLEDIRDVNVIAALECIGIPMLILHGTKDKIVGITESRYALEKANRPDDLAEIKGANHRFSAPQSKQEMVRKLLCWLKDTGSTASEEKNVREDSQAIYFFLPLFFGLVAVVVYFLGKPLRLKYADSWMVFALFSMLSLQYVELTNRLKDKLGEHKRFGERKRKAGRAAFLLRWTNLFFIFALAGLAFRIGLMSFYPGLWRESGTEHSYSWYLLLASDGVTVASFAVGFVLRVFVFGFSYWRDLLKRNWPKL